MNSKNKKIKLRCQLNAFLHPIPPLLHFHKLMHLPQLFPFLQMLVSHLKTVAKLTFHQLSHRISAQNDFSQEHPHLLQISCCLASLQAVGRMDQHKDEKYFRLKQE